MSTTTATSIITNSTFDQADVDKALNLAQIAIWQFSYDTKQITAHENLYQILGFPSVSSSVSLHDFKTIIHPDDTSRIFHAFEQHVLKASKETLELQFRMKTASNQWKWLRNKSTLNYMIPRKDTPTVNTLW